MTEEQQRRFLPTGNMPQVSDRTVPVYEALTLDGIEAVVWQVRNRHDSAAIALANRHYSREIPNWKQVGGPCYVLVLVTPCERAAWITQRHSAEVKAPRITADGYPPDTYRCGLFRNEGAGLSSTLIGAAMELTERLWGAAPSGWQTYVDRSRIASVNPGYCFKQAGWVEDGWRGSKLSLVSVGGVPS